jgi:hypothetical protein
LIDILKAKGFFKLTQEVKVDKFPTTSEINRTMSDVIEIAGKALGVVAIVGVILFAFKLIWCLMFVWRW